MILRILCFLVIAGVCSAQKPIQTGVIVTYTQDNGIPSACVSKARVNGKCVPFCDEVSSTGSCVPRPKPAPLKCGEYEEFEPAHSVGTSNLMAMTVPDRCVPKLHTVTEKEWQELQQRLNVLEQVAHFVLKEKP